jgi:hypothetical protein
MIFGPLPRRRVLISGAALGTALSGAARAAAQSIVGGRTVEAVHRSVLVRFPEAAEASAVGQGFQFSLG